MRTIRPIAFVIVSTLTACGGGSSNEGQPTANEVANASIAAPVEAGIGSEANASAAAPAARMDPPAGGMPRSQSGYRLIGTEPFWGGTLSGGELVYSTPENQAGDRIAVDLRFQAGQEIYSGRLDGQPLMLVLTDGPCSDGMSDNVHAFTAQLKVKGETRQGCANPQ